MKTPRGRRKHNVENINAANVRLYDQLVRLDTEGTCAPWAAREVLDLDAGPHKIGDVARALHRRLHKMERESEDGDYLLFLRSLKAARVLIENMTE